MDNRLRRRPWIGHLIVGLALAFALGGCSDDGENAVTPLSDEDYIRSLMTEDSDVAGYFDLEAMRGDPEDFPSSGGSILELSPIETLLKWRRFRVPTEREITIEFSEGLAYVGKVITYEGSLALYGIQEGSESAALVEKPLVDRAERHAVFVRMDMPETMRHPYGGWRLDSISPIEVESRTDGALPTVAITRLQVEVEGQDPWVLEEAGLVVPVPLREGPQVAPGVEVRVTIETTGGPALAFLHTRAHNRHLPHPGAMRMRLPMVEGPEGTFTQTFIAPADAGRYHLAADLLTEASLMETDPALGPYDSNIWGTAFIVEGETGSNDAP